MKKDSYPAIALTPELHSIITKRWRKAIPYGTPYGSLTKKDMIIAVNKVYKDTGMHQSLIKSGIKNTLFKEVCSKRGDYLAYEFIADSTLPSGALFSARFNEAKPCRKCGNINFKYRESFEYNPYYIKKECIDKLGTITKTSDYFAGDPILIISPELRNKIVELCPDAQFEPVWTEEKMNFFNSYLDNRDYGCYYNNARS